MHLKPTPELGIRSDTQHHLRRMNLTINPGLAALSLLVAVMSVYTALDLTARLRAAKSTAAIWWLLGGSVHLGGGLWATHQISLIAMEGRAPLLLDGRLLLLSLLLAIGTCAFALYRVGRAPLSTRGLLPGALSVGIGISAMHLCAAAALLPTVAMVQVPWAIASAVLITSVAALAGLRAGLSAPDDAADLAFGRRLIGALAIGAAIFVQQQLSLSAMHRASSSLPSVANSGLWVMDLSELALAVAVVILVLLCISLLASRTSERQAQSRQRLLRQLEASNQELAAEVQARKRMQRHLLDSEARFRAAFEDAAIGMALLSPSGRWRKLNGELLAMLGGQAGLWHEQSIQEAIPADEWPMLEAEMRRLLACEPNGDGLELQLRQLNGEWRWVRLHLALLRDDQGQPAHFVAQIQDISERHLLEAELKRSNQELEHFAYAASHDLQAPLRGISGFAKLLQRRYAEQLDEEGREYLQLMLDSTRSMNDLIQALLELGRVGRGGIDCQPLDLRLPIDDACARLQALIVERSAVVHLPDALPTVLGDSKLLAQLFQNLISNAIKFQPGEQPRVDLTVAGVGDFVRVDVRDYGIGIEARHFERIFRIFQRLHTQDEFLGSGIGLSICEKIARLHGGSIQVSSVPGNGSCFSVLIQRASAEP